MRINERLNEKIAEARQSMLEIPAVDSGDLTFFPSVMAMLSLPASPQPGSEYVRQAGAYRLSVLTPREFGIPFGSYARGILNHIATETVRRKNQQQADPRTITIGDSLTKAVERITGKQHTSGGPRSARDLLSRQLLSLVNSSINFRIATADEVRGGNMNFSSQYRQRSLWQPQLVGSESPTKKEITIHLGEDFYADLVRHAVAIDDRIFRVLWRSPLMIDIYVWLTYRANVLPGGMLTLKWHHLIEQFGAGYNSQSIRSFKVKVRDTFTILRQVYDPRDVDCIKLDEVGDSLHITVKRPSVPSSAVGTFHRRSLGLPGISQSITNSRKPKPPLEGQRALNIA